VLAAEYINAGRTHRGFLFASKDKKVKGLFDDKGNSMEKDFLKNPLELARITSRFGQRFHPVLKRRRQHNGVDYGAARGTPFWAVASGTVVDARYSRTAGNMVRIKHKNGLITEYFHASRFAKGIRKGARVQQRQVIGYVGTTGRSTGPHLHYGMVKRGRHVNPSRQKFGSSTPVPEKHLAEYLKTIAPLLAELDALEIS
jgi:murein DD-endopeptidase MepM/ murein hydrolase activator NlpD